MLNWLNGIRFKRYQHKVMRLADTLVDDPIPDSMHDALHGTVQVCYGEAKPVKETARIVAATVNDAKRELDSWMKIKPISMR